jgi:hypothetical protein
VLPTMNRQNDDGVLGDPKINGVGKAVENRASRVSSDAPKLHGIAGDAFDRVV